MLPQVFVRNNMNIAYKDNDSYICSVLYTFVVLAYKQINCNCTLHLCTFILMGSPHVAQSTDQLFTHIHRLSKNNFFSAQPKIDNFKEKVLHIIYR